MTDAEILSRKELMQKARTEFQPLWDLEHARLIKADVRADEIVRTGMACWRIFLKAKGLSK